MFTNKTGIPLSLALWLCDDDYDHSNEPNTISATSLLKPMRALTLARQNKDLVKIGDVEAMIPSRMGTALHSAIERTWLNKDKVKILLKSLGYADSVVERTLVNPKPEEITEASICIYMELRGHKKVGKYTVSGKFDFVIEGALEDFKSTGVYNWISGSNKEKYRQQGSIYHWLHPDIITEDVMKIQYIFTDWSKIKSLREANYPKKRLMEQKIPLMSLEETQIFIQDILKNVEKYENSPQVDLPKCTSEELWQKPDVFKYYKDPNKTQRATKNFESSSDAQDRLIADGHVGVVKTFKGEVVRCRYCDVVGICDQAQSFIKNGTLFL